MLKAWAGGYTAILGRVVGLNVAQTPSHKRPLEKPGGPISSAKVQKKTKNQYEQEERLERPLITLNLPVKWSNVSKRLPGLGRVSGVGSYHRQRALVKGSR